MTIENVLYLAAIISFLADGPLYKLSRSPSRSPSIRTASLVVLVGLLAVQVVAVVALLA